MIRRILDRSYRSKLADMLLDHLDTVWDLSGMMAPGVGKVTDTVVSETATVTW